MKHADANYDRVLDPGTNTSTARDVNTDVLPFSQSAC